MIQNRHLATVSSGTNSGGRQSKGSVIYELDQNKWLKTEQPLEASAAHPRDPALVHQSLVKLSLQDDP